MLLCRLAHTFGQFTNKSLAINMGVPTVGLLAFLVGCGGSAKAPPDAAQRFIEAQEAIARGDNAAALESLQASIDADPNVFAYMERIKINAKQGSDAAVEEDLQAILKIDEDNRDIGWVRAEMKKPAAARFDPNAKAPSSSK